MKLTPGKLKGMKAVSNDRGVIAAAAMDQRGSLKKALGTHANDAGLEEFKVNVTEVLTQHASAILLDPQWGLPAARRRAKGSGLLLAYEKTGYDKALPGRLPDLLDLWSAKAYPGRQRSGVHLKGARPVGLAAWGGAGLLATGQADG